MKKFLMLIILTFCSWNVFSQQNLWTKTFEDKIEKLEKSDRDSSPKEYKLYSLNFTEFKNQLRNAPLDTSGMQSNLIMNFPHSNGNLEDYIIYEAPIMEKDLAEKYPNIKSYVGKGVVDKTATIRFSVTIFGLHTMTFSGNREVSYIDTYTKDLHNYIVYNKSSVSKTRDFKCLVPDTNRPTFDRVDTLENGNRASDGQFRVFRLAMACTIEYAAYHLSAAGTPGGASLAVKKGVVLAAMNVTMTRVNGIYERDMSMRMTLVGTNDLVIFITTDNFNNNNASVLIGQSQTQITNIIGDANFDIGHTVSTGGGGLAGPSPCVTGRKASGITGSPAPVGDPYDIDYVAHEIGHQFGANHTFNNSCGGNRNDGTAVEPGSGSTIMAYAGICTPNVQNNSDAHFHSISIAEIEALISGSANCAVTTPNGNAAPVISAGLDYTIPRSTPFILSGIATDANGDALTYCWEQIDTEISTQAPQASSISGPNFRSNLPISSPDRYMPVFTSVLANNITPTWEVVPSVARNMNFSLTVRDNRSPNGGQTMRDDMRVTVNGTAGPFLVTAPNTAVSWQVGTNQNVTWSVAGTTSNGVNTNFVDIYLITNGTTVNPILLASKVPNDGSETITVPNNVGTTNRIMVKGWNHIFYDVSNTNFSITAPVSTFGISFNGIAGEQNKTACTGSTVSFTIPYVTLGGFSGNTTFGVVGQPGGSTILFTPSSINSNGNVVMQISNTAASPVAFYSMTVTGTSGGITKTAPFYLDLKDSNFGIQTLTSPANLSVGQSTTVGLSWPVNTNATAYDVEIATDIAFTTIVNSGTVMTNSFTVTGLLEGTDYFWRVKPKNSGCEGTFSSMYKFTTGTTTCGNIYSNNANLNVPDGTGAGVYGATVTKNIVVPGSLTGNINSISVDLAFTHPYVDDLQVWITHPDGTPVYLWNHNCEDEFSSVTLTYADGAANGSIPEGASCTIAHSNGTYAPNTPLSVLAGKPAAGTWVLHARDYWNPDAGSIGNWSLDICVATPLGAEVFNGIENLAIYPNPNNGNFNVQFNSASNNEIKINIHDMRGRQIFNKTYKNNGLFNESLQLNNIQAGIYLVTIQDGVRKTTKKIVVE